MRPSLESPAAAKSLNLPATIVVPLSTSPLMVSKLRDLGAQVHQFGASWAEADAHLREVVMRDDAAGVYVPPFDHSDIWAGAATMIDELSVQMDVPVHGIVCSVGGGGLLNGIMAAVETEGAASLRECVRTGTHATLDSITSIATSLGARKVSAKTFEWLANSNLSSIAVEDWEAAMSCVYFADDARFVVEAACGATLAPAYFPSPSGTNRLRDAFERLEFPWDEHNVVLVSVYGDIAAAAGSSGAKAKTATTNGNHLA
ncbi:unnamed protein product [Parascedosporium putredinis]|uniref:L-serine ammonia-lyase n=1 Tax=Parascedosporium putredinis TaxID=1442378 RepID=A0A9P1GU22_9PEZI|nr:unnamed protein product [Parascedosporium putredinis]CAI7987392.1 unnamed protein product [Parascedosporium putredinis]